MRVKAVFFKEAVTWPDSGLSSSTSLDLAKPGIQEIKYNAKEQGVYAVATNKSRELTTIFIPLSNIKNVHFAGGNSVLEGDDNAWQES